MHSLDEKVGYLQAKVEEIKSDAIRVEQKLDNLSELVAKKFTTAETVFKIMKFGAVVVVAVVTFQFGDIKEWYNLLFK